MSVSADLELVVGILWLDLESVGTKVVTLSLEKVGRQVLGAVTIEEGQGGAECRHGNARLNSKGNNVSPARLSSVNSLVEEVVEEQVLEIRVLAVG